MGQSFWQINGKILACALKSVERKPRSHTLQFFATSENEEEVDKSNAFEVSPNSRGISDVEPRRLHTRGCLLGRYLNLHGGRIALRMFDVLQSFACEQFCAFTMVVISLYVTI